MSSEQERGYYMVRAMGQSEEEFDFIFDNNIVAVGWSDVDFTAFENTKQLRDAVNGSYYKGKNVSPTSKGKRLAQAARFHGIVTGDRILVPYHSSVCLCTARKERRYDESVVDTLDLSNQLQVDYCKTPDGEYVKIARKQLTEGLQRRLRVQGSSVSDLIEFATEIETLFTAQHYDRDTVLADKEEEQISKFKASLLSRIREGGTYLQAGGQGLESLVRDLLEVEGYNATVLGKRTFPGFADADVSAVRSDKFGDMKLLVQVKHHGGESSAWGADQLKAILDNPGFEDITLVLVTSGDASKELRKSCNEADIKLLTGTDLAEWIVEHLASLPEKTRYLLTVSNVPQLL